MSPSVHSSAPRTSSHPTDDAKPTWKRFPFLTLRRTKSAASNSISAPGTTSPTRSPIRDHFPSLPFRSASLASNTSAEVDSPLATLTSRQLCQLAVAVLHHLDEDTAKASNVEALAGMQSPVLQAARALAAPHLHSTNLDQHSVEATAKLARLPPDQLHRLAMDVERECERRFPDLAVSVSSVVGQKNVETVQRGSRVFLSLPRRTRDAEQGQNGSGGGDRKMPSHWRSHSDGNVMSDDPSAGGGEIQYGGMVGISILPNDMTSASGLASPPLRSVTDQLSHLTLNDEHGQNVVQDIRSPHSRPRSTSSISTVDNETTSLSHAQSEDTHNATEGHSILSELMEDNLDPEWFTAYPEESSLSLEATQNSLPHETVSFKGPEPPASLYFPEDELTAATASLPSPVDNSAVFTEALSILTTPQLLAAVRDVRGVMARRHTPDSVTNLKHPTASSTNKSKVHPELKGPAPDRSAPLTHCEELLLLLPMDRVRIIWAAVADEVKRRGIDVNVHMDLERIGVV